VDLNNVYFLPTIVIMIVLNNLEFLFHLVSHKLIYHFRKYVKHFEAIDLHHSIFENGKLVYDLPSEKETQDYLKQSLSLSHKLIYHFRKLNDVNQLLQNA
jgi:hypothetical protein